jgi:hypothetical protein
MSECRRNEKVDMMRYQLLAAAACTVAAVVLGAAPAMAAGNGPSQCKDVVPGSIVTLVEQSDGFGKYLNPGNGVMKLGPVVPIEFHCNPTAG